MQFAVIASSRGANSTSRCFRSTQRSEESILTPAGCHFKIVKMRIGDLASGGTISNRATIVQQKTGKPVQFELMVDARRS